MPSIRYVISKVLIHAIINKNKEDPIHHNELVFISFQCNQDSLQLGAFTYVCFILVITLKYSHIVYLDNQNNWILTVKESCKGIYFITVTLKLKKQNPIKRH
jgi:hypothetical protein